MSNTFGFNGAMQGLSRARMAIDRASENALDDCALLTQRTAVEGIEKTAGFLKQEWPRGGRLKESTIKARKRKQKSRSDRPLWYTGTLALGISFESSPGERIVGTPPDYAVYLEEGDWPFLEPSLEEAAPEFPDLFRAELRKRLSQLRGSYGSM